MGLDAEFVVPGWIFWTYSTMSQKNNAVLRSGSTISATLLRAVLRSSRAVFCSSLVATLRRSRPVPTGLHHHRRGSNSLPLRLPEHA